MLYVHVYKYKKTGNISFNSKEIPMKTILVMKLTTIRNCNKLLDLPFKF